MAQRDDNGRSLEQPTRHGTTNLKADKIALLARQLHNITINGVIPTISNNGMRFLIEAGAFTGTPFLLSINNTDTTKIDVGFGRTAFPSASYSFNDVIQIGNDRLFKSAVETSTALVGGSFIYYSITKSGATITAALTVGGGSRPNSINGTIRWVLGFAFFADGAITSVKQYQIGDIIIPSRVS